MVDVIRLADVINHCVGKRKIPKRPAVKEKEDEKPMV